MPRHKCATTSKLICTPREWLVFVFVVFILASLLVFVQTGPAFSAPTLTNTLDPTDQASAYFGFPVITAGDVNGDGYSDVVAAAPHFDNEATNEGRIYIYHGSASGISATADLTLDPTDQSARFGFDAATAGDVNGDGYDDIVVGALDWGDGTEGTLKEGRAYIYHGSSTGLSSTPALTLDPTDHESARFGISVATAGDVNGDGYSDVIIGAQGFDAEATDEGRAYVYHGSAAGLSSTPALTLDPTDQASANLGARVATAGDVNGDGYSDVLVGTKLFDADAANEGRVYVYHGSSTGLSSTPALTLDPTDQASALFGGEGSSTLGDINGDGYADVVISASGFDAEANGEGRAYIYHGSATGLSSTADLTLDPTDQLSAYFGLGAGTAGDVNGDGYSDMVVGAFGFDNEAADEGRAYLYYGSSSGLSSTPALTLDPTDQAAAYFGNRVGTAGDVNGDGYSDFVVAATFFEAEANEEGRVYLYSGAPEGLQSTAEATSDPTDQVGAQLGASIATAGDVNGDGYSDAIVGASDFDNEAADEGRVYVYHGSATGLSSTAALTLDPTDQEDAFFGVSAATAGDVNGDGYSDIIIGASGFDNEATNEGRAYIYHGSASGLSSTPALTLDPTDEEDAYFGRRVKSAGDVNGDGYADIAVGCFACDGTAVNEGKVYVYHGNATGVSSSPAIILAPVTGQAARFGILGTETGDVNGDGYSDLLVGADDYTNDASTEGAVFVFHGSGSGLSSTPALTLDPTDQTNASFGSFLSVVGDINSDGYSDVVITAVFFDAEATDEGRAYIYHGSATGLSSTPALTLDPTDQEGAFFSMVDGAGDVNGDGYSDVLVGAQSFDAEATNEGRAYIYHGSSTGLSSTPALTLDPTDQVSAYFTIVAGVGDVNGDGYSDVMIGAHHFDADQTDEGRAYMYYGGGRPGLSILPQQRRTDKDTSIPLLSTSGSINSVSVSMLARTPAGRGKVRLEVEAKPFDQAFDGTNTSFSAITDTGVSGTTINQHISLPAVENTLYHWRARLHYNQSPLTYFGGEVSRWFSPGNSPNEAHFRTARSRTTGSADIPPAPALPEPQPEDEEPLVEEPEPTEVQPPTEVEPQIEEEPLPILGLTKSLIWHIRGSNTSTSPTSSLPHPLALFTLLFVASFLFMHSRGGFRRSTYYTCGFLSVIVISFLVADTITIDSRKVRPGDILTYELILKNLDGASQPLLITDPIPQWTDLVPNSLSLNGVPKTDAPDNDEIWTHNGLIRILINSLPKGSESTISFSVKVREDVRDAVRNTAMVTGQDVRIFIKSNTVLNFVDE